MMYCCLLGGVQFRSGVGYINNLRNLYVNGARDIVHVQIHIRTSLPAAHNIYSMCTPQRGSIDCLWDINHGYQQQTSPQRFTLHSGQPHVDVSRESDNISKVNGSHTTL